MPSFLRKGFFPLAGTLLVNGGMLFLLASLHLSLPTPQASPGTTTVTVFRTKEEKKPHLPKVFSPRREAPLPKRESLKRPRKSPSSSPPSFRTPALQSPLPMANIRLEEIPIVETEDSQALPLMQEGSASPQEGEGVEKEGTRNPGEVDRNPVRIYCPRPKYPPAARRKMIEGWIRLRFVVDEEGRVGDVEILEWSGDEGFCVSAVKAVKEWRFQPAEKDNRRVSCYCYQKISFFIGNRS